MELYARSMISKPYNLSVYPLKIHFESHLDTQTLHNVDMVSSEILLNATSTFTKSLAPGRFKCYRFRSNQLLEPARAMLLSMTHSPMPR